MIRILRRVTSLIFIASLCIISIQTKAQTDASISGIDPSNRLSTWPVYFADSIALTGSCKNVGANTINNLKVTVEITDAGANLLYTDSAIYPSVGPLTAINYSIGNFYTNQKGVYYVKGYVTADGAPDADATNDTATAIFSITDSTLARDYSAFTGVTGVNYVGSYNDTAKIGNLFTIPKDDYLTSVYFKLRNPSTAGDTVRASIYGVDSLGLPDTTLIAQTIIYTIQAGDVTADVDLNLPIENDKVFLTAGTYMVAVNEYQGPINVAMNSRVFTNNTAYFLWPNLSTSAWITNETYGILQTHIIQPEFGCTLSAAGTTTDEICFNQNGTATAIPAFNSGSVSYLWSNGSTDQLDTALQAGTYTVTMTDEAGCSATATININNVQGPSIYGNTIAGTKCFNTSDGNALIYVTGGTGSISYLWSTGDTVNTIVNQPAGDYTVTITDQNGCTDQVVLNISQPDEIIITPSSTGTLCFGGSDGSVDATVTGGTGAYDYLWSSGDTTVSVLNLPAGTYTLNVTDERGCPGSDSVVVTEPTQIQVSPTIVDTKCFGSSDGSINVTVGGGTGSLGLLWSDGSTDLSITGKAAGTYTVTVNDQNGCTTSSDIIINEPAEIIITATPTNTVCYNGSDGTVSTSVVGGTGAYLYLWSTSETTDSISNLLPGTYSVTITDDNGCTSVQQTDVLAPDSISISISSIIDATCFGLNNGNATITATGGTGTISYLWSEGSTDASITNQTAGTYTVTATDQNGCSSSLDLSIIEPTQIDITTSFTNTSCFGSSDGSVGAVASGGTPGYTFLWSTGDTTDSVFNLPVATYYVTVTDNNNCTRSKSVDVDQPGPIVITTIVTNITCFGNVDGILNVSSLGGIGSIGYLWSNGETTNIINNLSSAVYTVTATDQNGCTSTASAAINEPALLQAFTSVLNVTCFGTNNGTVFALTAGGTGNISYLWSNGSTNASILNIGPGTYTVLIMDVNGCTASASDTITGPTQIQATTASTPDNGSANGTATVSNTTGGLPPYTYSWNSVPVQTNVTATGLAAATYTVSITDFNLCTVTDTVIVESSAGIFNHQDDLEFSITPNPARDVIFASIKFNQSTDVQLRITDINGKIVFEEQLKNVSILNKKISVETYSKGVYAISIQTQSGIETKRIVIE